MSEKITFIITLSILQKKKKPQRRREKITVYELMSWDTGLATGNMGPELERPGFKCMWMAGTAWWKAQA